MCLNRTEMPSSTPSSPVQPQGLSSRLEAWQLPIPPSSRSPAPSACSRWLPAAPSSASPAPPAQPAASGAAPSASAALPCAEEGSRPAAGSPCSGWLQGTGGNTREGMLSFLGRPWEVTCSAVLAAGLGIFRYIFKSESAVSCPNSHQAGCRHKPEVKDVSHATRIRSGNSTALGQFQY